MSDVDRQDWKPITIRRLSIDNLSNDTPPYQNDIVSTWRAVSSRALELVANETTRFRDFLITIPPFQPATRRYLLRRCFALSKLHRSYLPDLPSSRTSAKEEGERVETTERMSLEESRISLWKRKTRVFYLVWGWTRENEQWDGVGEWCGVEVGGYQKILSTLVSRVGSSRDLKACDTRVLENFECTTSKSGQVMLRFRRES